MGARHCSAVAIGSFVKSDISGAACGARPGTARHPTCDAGSRMRVCPHANCVKAAPAMFGIGEVDGARRGRLGATMELTYLRYFKTIAEHGSMTAAAKALNVSQPTITVAVKNLEKELGTTLL